MEMPSLGPLVSLLFFITLVLGANRLGDSLAKYGRARCRMAGAQEEFGQQLEEGYIANLGMT
jgi:hypothetical protein